MALASLALGLAWLVAGCRAFPVGIYVPDTVLDALEGSRYAEHLDERALRRELEARAGKSLAPVDTDGRAYWRLDAEPELGPLAPAAFDARDGPATAGLASGDLVLVKNPKAQSLATTLSFAAFTFYDHMGVLVERDGRWWVCDSWPSFHPFAKAVDFADRFRGGVRATPFRRFLAHYETLLVVRLAGTEDGARLAAEALASLDEGIEFDPHHDPADPRLSCCEYVESLLARAGRPAALAPHPLTDDAELVRALLALGFPPAGLLAPDTFAELPGARPVGWISRHRTRAGARALEAGFARLHERFRRDGHVADLLGLDRIHLLRLRANVALFLRWSEAWAEARGLEERSGLEEELRALEELFFRPLASD